MATVRELTRDALEAREPIELTTEDLRQTEEVLAKRRKQVEDILSQECVAKHKIEIMFSYRRSRTAPSPGMLFIWESGAKLHGGGDAKVYFCPGKVIGVNECSAIIPFDNSNYGHNFCPACKTAWKADQVLGEIPGNHTMQGWAKLTAKYFRQIGNNADIYIKQPKQDIRVAARAEQDRQLRGDRLTVVRSSRIVYAYPLKRIIQDTQNGSDLEERFYAFFKS